MPNDKRDVIMPKGAAIKTGKTIRPGKDITAEAMDTFLPKLAKSL